MSLGEEGKNHNGGTLKSMRPSDFLVFAWLVSYCSIILLCHQESLSASPKKDWDRIAASVCLLREHRSAIEANQLSQEPWYLLSISCVTIDLLLKKPQNSKKR